MDKHILITGGAGFIGSHLADELVDHGYRVRALDVLVPQVHGPEQLRPHYLNPNSKGQSLTPIPTSELKTPSPSSIYALSKYDQEQLCLTIGRAYDIPRRG